MAEYRNMVNNLRGAGVGVVEFDYPCDEMETPDAVFPNNWFSTTRDGCLFTFPMACSNRRREVRPRALSKALKQAGRAVWRHDDLTGYTSVGSYLESTGVMVMDHPNRTIYAALSERCERGILEEYARRIGYSRVVSFHTALPSGKPVYHTNVLMAIGEHFSVICDEVIPDYERRFVLRSLAKDKQIITITSEQMNHFCGNLLQLENRSGQKIIALSQTAYDAFTPAQRTQLESHGRLLPCDIRTIETIGGGSVRCMLGEVFLPEIGG